MQTLTTMDMAVVGDYYHMMIMDKNINWIQLTHPLSTFSLNLRSLFYIYNTLTSKILIAFLNVHSKEKQHISLMYV